MRETLSVGEKGEKENAPEAMAYEIDWIWGSELGLRSEAVSQRLRVKYEPRVRIRWVKRRSNGF